MMLSCDAWPARSLATPWSALGAGQLGVVGKVGMGLVLVLVGAGRG